MPSIEERANKRKDRNIPCFIFNDTLNGFCNKIITKQEQMELDQRVKKLLENAKHAEDERNKKLSDFAKQSLHFKNYDDVPL